MDDDDDDDDDDDIRHRHIPIPEVYYIDDCDDDSEDMRSKCISLLRGVSQVDLRSRRMVNQRFPKLAFLEHGIDHAHRFAHVCAKVDVVLFSGPLYIPRSRLTAPVGPPFLDLLRLLEHVHFENADFDLESLSAMPTLKSVSFPKTIDTMGAHEHGKSSFAQEPHAWVISPQQWEAIRESSSIWGKGVRLFVNPFGSCYSRDWQLAELFYIPASAGKREAVRILRFAVGYQGCRDVLPPLGRVCLSLALIMVNPSDPSTLSHHSSPSAKTEGPRLPYEIYLLIVDAFLDFAYTEFSAKPGLWRPKSEPQCGTDSLVFPRQMYFPPRLVLNSDGGQIRLRHRLLRGISQTDIASQKKVNQRFPKFPYKDHWIDQNYIDYPGFAHVCPSVDIFEHDWEPTYTTKPRLCSLSQPAPDNLGLLRAIENIQLHAWCGTDSGLPSFLSALPNLQTVSFIWQPPGPYGPPAANPGHHAHNDPPAVYKTHSRIVEITEWWKIIRQCSFAWEKGVRLFHCYLEDCAWPGHWPSDELLFDPTLGEFPFRTRQFVADCNDCLDALPRYSLRERSA
ncbi:hypothetical protein GQ607_003924, partial [Colletotrichum asianum]